MDPDPIGRLRKTLIPIVYPINTARGPEHQKSLISEKKNVSVWYFYQMVAQNTVRTQQPFLIQEGLN